MQRTRKISIAITTLGVILLVLTSLSASQAASKEKVLYVFSGGNDGSFPSSSLISDKAGNFYGTTRLIAGAVFKLMPSGHGTWTETTLYTFCSLSNCLDGAGPNSLIFDVAGNLYGTTLDGGANSGCISGNCGTIFELSPHANGTWTEKVLHNFQNDGKDGWWPHNVIIDTAGNLYGFTGYGGASGTGCGGFGCGAIFELTPGAHGTWTEKVLHSFNGSDGASPSGLTIDAAGHLFGTSAGGGDFSSGVVFMLTHGAKGQWSYKILYSFDNNNKDGYWPDGVILGAAGNLYGSTYYGGTSGSGCGGRGCGTVFELVRGKKGKWTEKLLYSFQYNFYDGEFPSGSLIFDKAGNLYGTTSAGGTGQCPLTGCGTAFELTPGARGRWHEKVLHSFQNDGIDGLNPAFGLTFDQAGNLYGVTGAGPANSQCNCGTVYELTP